MIVPMKKIHIIVQKKDVTSALLKVRDLGLLHIEHQGDLAAPQISDLRAEINMLRNVCVYLQQRMKQEEQKAKKVWLVEKELRNRDLDPVKKGQEVLFLLSEIEQIKEDIVRRQIEINQWESWGDFNVKDFQQIEQTGFHVRLCETSAKEGLEIPEGVYAEELTSYKGVRRYLVIFPRGKKLPFPSLPLPSLSLSEMKSQQNHDQREIEHIESELLDFVPFLEIFESALKEHTNKLRFEEASKGMKEYETLSLLRGYCPQGETARLEHGAKQEQWGIIIEDPGKEDQVPTLLKNPKWVSIIKPVFNIINVLPGYREMDVSLVFLVFFALFVGILVGDAGYGMLVLLAFGAVHVKLLKDQKQVPVTNFILVYLLCGCTIIWGLLTGTFFGQQWIASSLKPAVPWLVDDKNFQILCFLIGTVHLSIAHLWNSILKYPSLKALSDIGWMLIIWGMYSVAKFLVLGVPMISVSYFFLGIGAVLVLFFTKPQKNIFKAIGPGLGDILLNGVNSFTDVVSYIRLYAVSLATVAVADAANGMSIGWVILLHVVNLVLAGLAILVHGIRLNILEFSSSHLNLEWSGFRFNPFRKEQEVS